MGVQGGAKLTGGRYVRGRSKLNRRPLAVGGGGGRGKADGKAGQGRGKTGLKTRCGGRGRAGMKTTFDG